MEENRNDNSTEPSGEDAQGDSSVMEATPATDSTPEETIAVTGGADAPVAAAVRERRRQEKVGLVTSDKMTKTVVVRVERLVRHPKYKRYIRRRTKFMAHNELEAKTGDTVRIIASRPLSARKRWRVVEIIQRAR
jgi:small subunit ribosomal protein S17